MATQLEYISEEVQQVVSKLSPEGQREVLDFAYFIAQRESQPRADQVQVKESPDTERALEHQWLKEHGAEYAGQYVVLEGNRLISHATEGKVALQTAREAGVKSPFITCIESPEDLPFGGW